MTNIEKALADEILGSAGLKLSAQGLRFDRVVVRMMADLRACAEAIATPDLTFLVTISAPIKLPAKTAGEIKERMASLLTGEAAHATGPVTILGNRVAIATVAHRAPKRPALIGFVHNPDVNTAQLVGLAEQWLKRG